MACRGDFGRLGHGSCSDYFVPHPIKLLAGMEITMIACGDTHSIALSSAGKLYAFGRNQNGQLGLGTSTDCLSPTLIAPLKVVHLHQSDMLWCLHPPTVDMRTLTHAESALCLRCRVKQCPSILSVDHHVCSA